MGLPHGGVVGFTDVSSTLEAEVLTQLSVLLRVAHFFLLVSSISVRGRESVYLCNWFHLGAVSVCLAHGYRLCRDMAVLLIASIAIWISDIFAISHLKLEKLKINGT